MIDSAQSRRLTIGSGTNLGRKVQWVCWTLAATATVCALIYTIGVPLPMDASALTIAVGSGTVFISSATHLFGAWSRKMISPFAVGSALFLAVISILCAIGFESWGSSSLLGGMITFSSCSVFASTSIWFGQSLATNSRPAT